MMTQVSGGNHPFDSAMPKAAEALLGAPNAQLSRPDHLRYGTYGSLHIDLTTGTFFDHESKTGGGVLDLISRQTGRDHKGAVEWLKEHGLMEEDRRPAPPGKIVAAYDYVDQEDNLVFQVARFEPKTFRQRRRDETGAWTWKVAGIRQVPYHLPDLIEAIAMERTIFVAEGEKDVDNLRKAGMVATCNAGGAGKWPDELTPYFGGADIVILPDNDIAGQDHAALVIGKLAAVAKRVRVVDLPNLPPKGDVSDWIAAGGTAIQLHDIVETTPSKPFISKFGALRWEEIGLSNGALGYAWFVEDVIPMGEISLAFGDSGTGKSFSMFDMAMAGTRGLLWNGRNVERGLVVYVAAEAGKGFSKRKIAYSIQHSLQQADPLPFVLLTKRPNFFHDDTDVMALIAEIKTIYAMYNLPLVAIIIDTLSALAPGMNENASQDVSMVRKRLVMLQDQFTAAIVLVHHKPKGGSTPRGHGSLTADFETTIEFETVADKRTDGGKIIHRATVRKQREGKSGMFWEFTLPVVEVGRNKWGNPETSCAVIPFASGSQKTAAVGFHATPNEKLFLRALYDAMAEHPMPPPVGLPKSIDKVVELRHVRQIMKERTIAPHEDSAQADTRFRVAFKRAGDALRDGAVIGVQGLLVWPTGKPVNGFGQLA